MFLEYYFTCLKIKYFETLTRPIYYCIRHTSTCVNSRCNVLFNILNRIIIIVIVNNQNSH